MKKRQSPTNATLREVGLCHLMLKIHKITGKIGAQFCNFTFLGVSHQTICKFAEIQVLNSERSIDISVLDSLTSMTDCC